MSTSECEKSDNLTIVSTTLLIGLTIKKQNKKNKNKISSESK